MKLTDYAKKHGVCYRTAWNWFNNGQIDGAFKMPSGTIIVPDEILKKQNKSVCIYCRVSNNSRRKELDYQVDRCLEFCRTKGIEVLKIYKEVASGMNDNRKELWKMLDSSPGVVVVEHKDRLTRFGFNYLEKLLDKQGTEIIVINRDNKNDDDLLKDMVSVITSFCCRLYGLRRGMNKTKNIKKELADEMS
jgi:predicted site-specific integrase-resolvase